MIEEAPTGAVTLDEALAHGIAFTRAARVNLTAHADTASTAWLRGCDVGTGTRLGLGLAALAWRELRDPDRRRTCEALIDIPSAAPVVALKLTHERRRAMEALGPTHPPVEHDEAMVFALEIEGDDPEWPRAVVHWVHAGSAQHEVAAVWTSGADASAERPLVVGMRWDEPGGGEGAVGAMRWPAPGETGGREERAALDIAARSHGEWMRATLVPTIVHRAMQAWAGARARAEADGPAPARGGFRRSAGAVLLGRGARGAKRRKQQWREARARMRNAPPLESAPCPQTTHERADALPREPGTGLDAMLMAAARLQDQMSYGGRQAAQIWSDAWWHRAEGGMISWRALGAVDAAPDEAGIIMRSGDLHQMMGAPCQRALRCASEIGFKILDQTGRTALVRSTVRGEVHGIKVPERLWRAIGEAGPHPEPAEVHAEDRCWYVEIERPEPDEPRALALWTAPGDTGERSATGLAIWTAPAPATPQAPMIAAWREDAHTGRWGGTWAWLEGGGKAPLAPGTPSYALHRRRDLEQAMDRRMDKVFASGGTLDRTIAAITEHLTRGSGAALALAPEPQFNPAAARESAAGEPAGEPTALEASIFILVRAPDPLRAAQAHEAGEGASRAGASRGPLAERQYVVGHYKRQRCGPGGRLRRLMCIEGYWRGPEPGDAHVGLEELAAHEGAKTERGAGTEAGR